MGPDFAFLLLLGANQVKSRDVGVFHWRARLGVFDTTPKLAVMWFLLPGVSRGIQGQRETRVYPLSVEDRSPPHILASGIIHRTGTFTALRHRLSWKRFFLRIQLFI